MTKAELIATARLDLNDTATPYLWLDQELTSFLQDAEKEAAERADLIEVEGVDAYCKISIVAGTASYAANQLVYEINKAWITGETFPLIRTSREILNMSGGVWENDEGPPEEYMFDGTIIRLHPKPVEGGTLNLIVNRLPISTMGTSPEIHAKHHERLLDWVYFRAYKKRDADTYDPIKALSFKQMFAESFGESKEEQLKTRQKKHSPVYMKDSN